MVTNISINIFKYNYFIYINAKKLITFKIGYEIHFELEGIIFCINGRLFVMYSCVTGTDFIKTFPCCIIIFPFMN